MGYKRNYDLTIANEIRYIRKKANDQNCLYNDYYKNVLTVIQKKVNIICEFPNIGRIYIQEKNIRKLVMVEIRMNIYYICYPEDKIIIFVALQYFNQLEPLFKTTY